MPPIARRVCATLLVAVGGYGLIGALWFLAQALDGADDGGGMGGVIALFLVPLASIAALMGLVVLCLGVLAWQSPDPVPLLLGGATIPIIFWVILASVDRGLVPAVLVVGVAGFAVMLITVSARLAQRRGLDERL
jgi:hypothetical protein